MVSKAIFIGVVVTAGLLSAMDAAGNPGKSDKAAERELARALKQVRGPTKAEYLALRGEAVGALNDIDVKLRKGEIGTKEAFDRMCDVVGDTHEANRRKLGEIWDELTSIRDETGGGGGGGGSVTVVAAGPVDAEYVWNRRLAERMFRTVDRSKRKLRKDLMRDGLPTGSTADDDDPCARFASGRPGLEDGTRIVELITAPGTIRTFTIVSQDELPQRPYRKVVIDRRSAGRIRFVPVVPIPDHLVTRTDVEDLEPGEYEVSVILDLATFGLGEVVLDARRCTVPSPPEPDGGGDPTGECDPGADVEIGGRPKLAFPILDVAEVRLTSDRRLADLWIRFRESNEAGAPFVQVLVTPDSPLEIPANGKLTLTDFATSGADAKVQSEGSDSNAADFLDIDAPFEIAVEFGEKIDDAPTGTVNDCIRVTVDGKSTSIDHGDSTLDATVVVDTYELFVNQTESAPRNPSTSARPKSPDNPSRQSR